MVALILYESLLICNEKVNIIMHVQDKMNILSPSTYQKLRISITVNCITSGEFFFAIVCILKENWDKTAIRKPCMGNL